MRDRHRIGAREVLGLTLAADAVRAAERGARRGRRRPRRSRGARASRRARAPAPRWPPPSAAAAPRCRADPRSARRRRRRSLARDAPPPRRRPRSARRPPWLPSSTRLGRGSRVREELAARPGERARRAGLDQRLEPPERQEARRLVRQARLEPGVIAAPRASRSSGLPVKMRPASRRVIGDLGMLLAERRGSRGLAARPRRVTAAPRRRSV